MNQAERDAMRADAEAAVAAGKPITIDDPKLLLDVLDLIDVLGHVKARTDEQLGKPPERGAEIAEAIEADEPDPK